MSSCHSCRCLVRQDLLQAPDSFRSGMFLFDLEGPDGLPRARSWNPSCVAGRWQLHVSIELGLFSCLQHAYSLPPYCNGTIVEKPRSCSPTWHIGGANRMQAESAWAEYESAVKAENEARGEWERKGFVATCWRICCTPLVKSASGDRWGEGSFRHQQPSRLPLFIDVQYNSSCVAIRVMTPCTRYTRTAPVHAQAHASRKAVRVSSGVRDRVCPCLHTQL
eukprot:4844510-Prymnesium_polylepis.1